MKNINLIKYIIFLVASFAGFFVLFFTSSGWSGLIYLFSFPVFLFVNIVSGIILLSRLKKSKKNNTDKIELYFNPILLTITIVFFILLAIFNFRDAGDGNISNTMRRSSNIAIVIFPILTIFYIYLSFSLAGGYKNEWLLNNKISIFIKKILNYIYLKCFSTIKRTLISSWVITILIVYFGIIAFNNVNQIQNIIRSEVDSCKYQTEIGFEQKGYRRKINNFEDTYVLSYESPIYFSRFVEVKKDYDFFDFSNKPKFNCLLYTMKPVNVEFSFDGGYAYKFSAYYFNFRSVGFDDLMTRKTYINNSEYLMFRTYNIQNVSYKQYLSGDLKPGLYNIVETNTNKQNNNTGLMSEIIIIVDKNNKKAYSFKLSSDKLFDEGAEIKKLSDTQIEINFITQYTNRQNQFIKTDVKPVPTKPDGTFDFESVKNQWE